MMTPSYDNVTPLRGSPGISDLAFEAQKALVNHEAEQALLGAILLDNRAYDAVSDFLGWEDFAHPLHGRIYAAAGSLIAGGQAATPISLNSFFSDDELLKTNGGSGYLATLAVSAVTIINSYWYGKTIFDLARRREVVAAAEAAIIDAASPNPDRNVEAVIDDAEQLLHDIGETTASGKPLPLATIMPRTIEAVEAAYKRAATLGSGAIVVNTGLSALDRIMRGMSAGDLVVLAGRPAMGKTAAAGTVTVNAANGGKIIAFFSLEMTAEQLAMRWIAGRTGIATDRQRHGEVDQLVDWPALIEARDYLAGLPIHVDEEPRLSVGQIRQRARRIRRRHGLDLVVIDHLQLMRQGGRQESRRTEIGDITSSLKAIAKELQVPVLLLSQLNRALETRDDKRPTMADLKESGDIEQDADVIVFIHRDEYYLERSKPKRQARQTEEDHASEINVWQDRFDHAKGKAELIVAKNRQGRTGLAHVAWDAQRQRLEDPWSDDIR